MRRVLVLTVMLLAGCRDKGVAELEGIRVELCKCTTSKCAEDAMKKVPAVDAANTHRTQQLAREMMECLAKLYESERPQTGPDDDDEAGGPAAPAQTATAPAAGSGS